jgi:glycosyltransferase involved in cell wall biosynthesis
MVDMIQAKGLMNHFLFAGPVPRDKVVFYINAMDVCVAPFTRKRNERIGLSPLKIYDYLACGKPVVASDIRGVGDLLLENEVGITIRPEDPASLARGVLRALEDHDLAARCLQRGPAIVKKNFTWQITAQKVAKVCSETLG